MSKTQVYLVPTPIGNLEDFTFRAVRVLKEVDFILAEDTRNSAKLLKHYNISTPMFPYHMHNEHVKTDIYLQKVKNGETLAVISDGGTPGISDPGYLIVKKCLEWNIPFETLPGATAFVPALIDSGFPNHEFYFAGFLPPKKGRKSKLEFLAQLNKTLILYESPHKINKLLNQLTDYFPIDTPISVSRELTKIHEETMIASLSEMINKTKDKNWKGEIVLCIDNSKEKKQPI